MLIENQEELDDFLAHVGVKGMKWGVRKEDRGHGLTSFMIKNGATKDDAGRLSRTFSRMAGTTRLGVAGVNSRYKGVDLTKDPAAKKKYEAEIKGVMQRGVKQGFKNTALSMGIAASVITLNPAPGSAVAAGIGAANLGVRLYRSVKNIKEYATTRAGDSLSHAEGDELIIPIIFSYDTFGLVTDVRFDGVDEDYALAQSELDELDDFLAHVGVKGMKWGVRKSVEERRAARTGRIQERAKKSIAKSEQMQARAASDKAAADAKTAAADARAAAKAAKYDAKAARYAARKQPTRLNEADQNAIEGVSGRTNREAIKNRGDAAKNARTLDDQTLKDYTQRLNTEKQLKTAIREDTAPRRNAARKLINEAGKDVAKTALVGLGGLAVYAVLHKFGPGVAKVATKKGTDEAFKDAAETFKKTRVPKSKMPRAGTLNFPNAIPTTGRAF